MFGQLSLLIGDELGSSTDIDRLLVSAVFRTAVYTKYQLVRERRFLELRADSRPKMFQKKVIYVPFFCFLGYLGKIESDPQTVWTSICTCRYLCHRECLQVLICSGRQSSSRTSRIFVRFWLAQLVQALVYILVQVLLNHLVLLYCLYYSS